MGIKGVLLDRAESELAAVTRYLEARYTGGTPFFDALDEELRDKHWFFYLFVRYLNEFPSRPHIIVSGKFGLSFATWLNNGDYSLYAPYAITVPGNLRHTLLAPFEANFDGEEFAFLDDSYYKGRTYGQVKERVEEANGKMLGAVVLYDGSPTPPVIPSFYRYHR